MRALLLALAFVFVAAPALAQKPPADWKPWRYPDLHIAFRAPPEAQPVVQRSTIDVDGDPNVKASDDHIVVLDAGHYALMVGVSDWSGNTHAMNIDGVPAGAVKGMSMQFVGPVRTVAWPGGQARDYDASKDKVVVRARAILVGRRLFQAMVLSDTGVLPPVAEAFIASVQPLP